MKNSKAEPEIRKLINERAEAIKNKNIQTATVSYAADVLLFHVVGPLKRTGAYSVKQRLEEWFSTFNDDGKIGFEIVDLQITADGDIAFCNCLNHVDTNLKDGAELNMYWRETLNWEKRNGEWKIVHAHSSVPFDAQSRKASTNLKPGPAN